MQLSLLPKVSFPKITFPNQLPQVLSRISFPTQLPQGALSYVASKVGSLVQFAFQGALTWASFFYLANRCLTNAPLDESKPSLEKDCLDVVRQKAADHLSALLSKDSKEPEDVRKQKALGFAAGYHGRDSNTLHRSAMFAVNKKLEWNDWELLSEWKKDSELTNLAARLNLYDFDALRQLIWDARSSSATDEAKIKGNIARGILEGCFYKEWHPYLLRNIQGAALFALSALGASIVTRFTPLKIVDSFTSAAFIFQAVRTIKL